jgi:asparagine synthetase B (glutamine-hydrolysing)
VVRSTAIVGLPVENSIVTGLNEFQRHRGPNGEGLWAPDDQRVALGHRGLVIIETGRMGGQPMTDLNRRWVVTFNGGIYNHQELRAKLGTLGCFFDLDLAGRRMIVIPKSG